MATGRAPPPLLRPARWLLPLTAPACCVVWMLLAFAPPPPPALDAGRRDSFHVTVAEIADAMARRRAAVWPPVTGDEDDVVHASQPAPARQEINQITDTSPPPPPERRARPQTSPPPPPEHELIVDTSPPPQPARQERKAIAKKPAAMVDRCAGRYIYIHDLPRRFNTDLLHNCRSLSEWMDMCKHVANAGMGPRLTRTGGVVPPTGWHDTNQFTLEVIFHNRMTRQYGCLTSNASLAAAVYVPYYAGLDVGRHLWGSFSNDVRDKLVVDLVAWLRSTPTWAARGGRDHFLVAGRIAWDFRRQDGGEWGSRFLLFPETTNMTALVLKSGGPWHAGDVGVPYPIYFHPSRGGEVSTWQRTVRRARRPWLFAFAGARRRAGGDGEGATLRDVVMDQCARSRRCGLLQCGGGGGGRKGRRVDDCYAPGNVVRHFKGAAFCLQPPGDSYTRRSAFDAMLAGCVPVFFHPGSAYTQYRWHLPAEYAKYSVLVPGDGVRVEDVLRRFRRSEVAAMREQVVRMIPGIVYRDPRAPAGGGDGFRDAFDIDGVIGRVGRIKRGLPPWEDDDDQRRWDGYFDSGR